MTAFDTSPKGNTFLNGNDLCTAQPGMWLNPDVSLNFPGDVAAGDAVITLADIEAAQARFQRFAPLLVRLFPELTVSHGVIESNLCSTPALQQELGLPSSLGTLWVKADHTLPIAGSIKARGGIHEVLEFAEKLALEHSLVAMNSDYAVLAEPAARAIFSRYQVAVGSTGNLGLSIGTMASALGFRAVVHMSSDAKQWKKDRLRSRGTEVVEHAGDYMEAVAAGRRQAQQDPYSYFVDDEHSLSLLLGYSAAALNLRSQLENEHICVDAEHPLFVYLPCGVGGAPAGITFGLKQLYGAHVHCFFAEPTQSPCFMVQMMDRRGGNPSVYEFGLTNRTEADGLAVPRASALAAQVVRRQLSGIYTVDDDTLFRHLYLAYRAEKMHIEPSAAAGFSGPTMLVQSDAGRAYIKRHQLDPVMHQSTHLVWTTGGSFVPEDEYARFVERGAALTAR